MKRIIGPSKPVRGTITAPGSKSHTIRGLIIATLASGKSTLLNPLDSSDTRSCLDACKAFGAVITERRNSWVVTGTAGNPVTPGNVVDVGNSGTSLYLLASVAALQEGWTVFTGDDQIRSRPAGPLLDSLKDLGAEVFSTRANGAAPFLVKGPLIGGDTEIECPTSQYLSSLLMAAPLAKGDTRISVPLLNERPYAEMTLSWLDTQGIAYINQDFQSITIPGNQAYRHFARPIPGDFSSATFFLCAAAIGGGVVRVDGLDFDDPQGDKAIVDYLEAFGCAVEKSGNYAIVHGRPMKGATIDLNATPDALPALAVTACFAEGVTRLVNVPQARLKETDRITVMREELEKMGGHVDETPDGMIIHGRSRGDRPPLAGASVDGRGDHRVVMSLAIGALAGEGPTEIDTVESVDVTVPGFFTLLESLQKE